MRYTLDTSYSTGRVYSNGDRTVLMTNNIYPVRGIKPLEKNKKLYWEVKCEKVTNGYVVIGVGNVNASMNSYDETLNRRVYYGSSGQAWTNTGKVYGAIYGEGDTVGIAVDLTVGTVTFYKNGASQGIAFNDLTSMGDIYPYASANQPNTPATATFNFAKKDLKYSIPQGYKALDFGGVLLQSNNKIYSLESIDKWYETKMTSNNSPVPLVASASSSYSTDYLPWRAFDGSLVDLPNGGNNCWLTSNRVLTGYIQLDFGKNTNISGFSLTPRQNSDVAVGINCMPKNFTFLGSDDGINYSVINEYKNESWTHHTQERTFTFKKPVSYRYYKLDVKEINGGTLYVAIGEIKFLKPMIINELPIASMKNFVNYGQTSLLNLSLPITTKNYTLQDIVSKNGQGLWTAKLDRKPLSISFK
ncbi:SPRY domain-containing protein [Lysinibacillus sp. M3]|uniref:SPRY domain-containing protein n=1 Tax=Lysinibacillus zambalensis TaxID=3160866 RepID=A0ABV1MRZ1_9BACI